MLYDIFHILSGATAAFSSTSKHFKNYPKILSELNERANIRGVQSGKSNKILFYKSVVLHLIYNIECLITYGSSVYLYKTWLYCIYYIPTMMAMLATIKYYIEIRIEINRLNGLLKNMNDVGYSKLNEISDTFLTSFENVKQLKKMIFLPVSKILKDWTFTF
jgi:hypothetical protein